jgi:phosphate transport system substrate-binding protein
MERDRRPGVSRRSFLLGAGASGVLTVAGCTSTVERKRTGGGGSGDGGGVDGGGNGTSSGGVTPRSRRLAGEVIIKGSSTVFPISDTFAEGFMESHPNVNVTVDSTGSGGGFKNHFCPGESDVNGASRPIKESEVDLCSANGVEPVAFRIAGDALTMAVNHDADWVDCLTLEEMAQIWREGGATTWSDVRPEWPDETITRYGPASTSGTFDWFNENVVGEEVRHTADYQPTEEDETIVSGIENKPTAIGYFGYAFYNSNPDLVKAVSVDGGSGCTPPSLENAKDGSYPMARPLFIYVSKAALQRDPVFAFLKYYLEEAATDTVADIGYVPSNTELRDRNVGKLFRVAGR